MSETTPAGWYPDGSGELRYWDGFGWTEHTAPDPTNTTISTATTVYTPTNPYSGNQGQAASTHVYVGGSVHDSNGLGTAGFVLAVIALFISWIPFAGWVTWVLGLVLSFAGMFKQPRGLAIAGLVISLIGVIMLILFATILASFLVAFA